VTSHRRAQSPAKVAEIEATTALVHRLGAAAGSFRNANDPLAALRKAHAEEYRRLLGDERERRGLRR